MRAWELAILKSVQDLGGTARSVDICKRTSAFIHLNPPALKVTHGRPAYYHAVRSYLSNLQQAGYMTRAGRGLYRLTPRGTAAIK